MTWATIEPPASGTRNRWAATGDPWARVIPAEGEACRNIPGMFADRRAAAHGGLFVGLDQLLHRRHPGPCLVG